MGDLYTYVSKAPFPVLASSSSSGENTVSTDDISSLPLVPKEERIAKAALMREASFKCAVFVGVPKVSLSALGKVSTHSSSHVNLSLAR